MSTTQSHSVPLDHWASVLAPLNEAERGSVNALADWISAGATSSSSSSSSSKTTTMHRDASASTRSAELLAHSVHGEKNGQLSRPPTASSIGAASRGETGTGLPNAALIDAPSYLAWFAKQQASIAASTHTGHAKALQEISCAAQEADELLDNLEAARVHIAELRAGVRMVEEGTEGLREEAEGMVERIDHLSEVAEALALRLTYFAILPKTTSFLSSPALSLVTTPEFFLTLGRLDVALAFLHAHPHYRDAPLYRMRFEHCIVRAGTLIRMYTLGRLKELSIDVGNKLKEWEKSTHAKGKEKEFDADSHAMMHLEDPLVHSLLWGKYEQEVEELRPLLFELERRALEESAPASTENDGSTAATAGGQFEGATKKEKGQTESDGNEAEEQTEIFRAPEFAALLQECRTAYLDARKALLSGMIAYCIARIEVMAVHPSGVGAADERKQDEQTSASTSSSKSADGSGNATSRLVDRAMLFLTTMNEAEKQLFARFFTCRQNEGHGNVSALHAYLRELSAPLDDRLKPRLVSEGGLAGLSAATMRSLDTWREYIVRFVS